MAKTKTKTMKFEEIRGIVEKSNVENVQELLETIDKTIESIAKKNASRTTSANAVANEGFRATIKAMIDNSELGLTITDIQTNTDNEVLATLSNQRMSAIISPLIDDKNYFRVKKGKLTIYATKEQAEKLEQLKNTKKTKAE